MHYRISEHVIIDGFKSILQEEADYSCMAFETGPH